MICRALIRSCWPALLLPSLVAVAWAQETPVTEAKPGPAAAAARNPVLVEPNPSQPATTSSRPRRARAISPEVAAQLAAAQPKYVPPPPKPPEPAGEEVDLREIDKPRNGIIRLPKFIVREPRPPVFSERAITTDKGLADIAKRRYLNEAYKAMNAFTLPLFGASQEQVAMAMYEEDERLRNMSEMSDQARMVSATDKTAGTYVRKQVQQTFARPGSFDWRPLSTR